MLRIAALRIVNDGFARIVCLLATNLREEGLKAIVVIQGPAIKGVIMTLGTLNAHSHENLGHVLCDLQGFAFHLVIVGWWVRNGSTRR